ncbi:cellulose binding domain-containing protein [Streptomyces sp. NPDC096152]|uniref:cellulose binding domain-containing protein n=1 Tax=Streptomyces sp. NPDC096152 TaxID=3366078 RepID=UPI003813F156
MPDLPSSKDATEAALFAECWDAVLSYADLCTAGSSAARQLATEAFALGMREVRAAGAGPSPGRRLPAMPLLLSAVRATAASWESGGLGHKLDPDLRLWLGSGKAARHTGPPLHRPLALRGLRDLQESDAALLWLAEVEALPLPVVARRLGLDPRTAADELDQVRSLFRDRCHRAHLDTPMDAQCRSYARLLDAVTRSPAAEAPGDLSRHLATCVECAEAAACLRVHGGGLPAALVGGVIGWGGLAYLERRRAAETRPGARTPTPRDAGTGEPHEAAARAKVVRGGLLAAAVLLSALALAVSMMPFGGSAPVTARGDDDRRPVADPGLSLPSPSPTPSASATPTHGPSASRTGTRSRPGNPDPEPQGTTASTAGGGPSGPAPGEPAGCRVHYDVVNQWPDGFEAAVTVTTARALDAWRVAWTYRDGQRVGQMWDATAAQDGSRVTATAADYNRSVPAHGRLSFGFIASWQDENSPPDDFTLNGHACAIA